MTEKGEADVAHDPQLAASRDTGGVVDPTEPDAVGHALGQLAGAVRHVLLLTDLASTGDPRDHPGSDPAEVLRLHDLLLLATQAAHPGVSCGGSPFACVYRSMNFCVVSCGPGGDPNVSTNTFEAAFPAANSSCPSIPSGPITGPS